jgi:intein/homing endonuclease
MRDNVRSDAANQQATRQILRGASETIRQALCAKDSVIRAYLQGALHDATFSSNRRFRFSQSGTSWLRVLQELLRRLGFRSWIYREGKKRKVYVLETLAPFLDFRFDPDQLATGEEQIAYIRGFFDAEGGIPIKAENRFYIQLVQKDRIKLEKIRRILLDLGIAVGEIHNPSVRIDPNYWRMFIRTQAHRKFSEMIGSWHPRKRIIFAQRMKI